MTTTQQGHTPPSVESRQSQGSTRTTSLVATTRAGSAEAGPLSLYFIEQYRFVDRYAIQPKAILL
jgi:hypothetical protein